MSVSDSPVPDLRVLQYGYATLSDWFFPDMNSPFWYLWRNRSGDCTVTSGGKCYLLDAEHYFLLPPFTSFSTSSRHGEMTQFYVHFSFPELDFRVHRKPIAIPAESVNHFCSEDFFRQFDEVQWEPRMLDLWIYSLVFAVLSRIPPEAVAPSGKFLIRKHTRFFIDYLNEHYQDRQPYRDFCSRQKISAATLLRTLKNDIHMTPQHYLIMLRMIKVKKLLLDTDYTLDEIAVRTGFSDRYHLSKTFRRYAGDSPASYRRSRGGGGAGMTAWILGGRRED